MVVKKLAVSKGRTARLVVEARRVPVERSYQGEHSAFSAGITKYIVVVCC